MESIFLLSSSFSSSPSTPLFNLHRCASSLSNFLPRNNKNLLVTSSYSRTPTTFCTSNLVLHNKEAADSISHSTGPIVDKSGRFCSPRSARELAISIIYAACLEGSDPVRLFDNRLNARREPGYEFDRNLLLKYNPMSFGGSPVTVNTDVEADELLLIDQMESEIESEVLSAPPKLVYSALLLRFARKLLVAVGESWDKHVVIIDKVAPPTWKDKPAGRILELCILHLAMAEISVLGTRHQIVINEAVDLAKRFCDGSAPRIINGCLRTYVKDLQESGTSIAVDTREKWVRTVR